MNTNRINALLAKIFLAGLAVCVTCAVVELVARRYALVRSPIEQRFPVKDHRRPKPYVMFSGQPNAQGLNELGYRGQAPMTPKPRNEYRIFMLGGSTVFVGAPTISELVQQRFVNAGMSHVRVYNFGVVSSVSGMELARITFEIADLEPDLIVMYNGGNDILHPYTWDPRPGYPFNFVAYERNPILDSTPGAYPVLALVAYKSVFMRRFLPSYFTSAFIDMEGLRRAAGYRTGPWKRQIADRYVANLVKAHRVSRAFGAEFVAFYQPLVYFKAPLTEAERRLGMPGEAEVANDVRRLILERMAQARESGVRAVDLSGVFANDWRALFNDAIHTKQIAMPPVADHIFDHIRRDAGRKP